MNIDRLYALFLSSTGISIDTRNIQEGNLFFALKGPSFNANDFAFQAVSDGAIAAIVDEDDNSASPSERIVKVDDALEALQALASHHRSKLKIPIIGLSGSNGKTTTKELMQAALQTHYRTYATKGNYNNHIGVPLSLLEIKPSHEIAIIEMGANHQKEIEFLCTLARPDYVLLTNIGLAHLEGFGGEEGVYKGKKELFDFARTSQAYAFLNHDDENVMKAGDALERSTYGISSDADFQGFGSEINFHLEVQWKRRQEKEYQSIKTNLSGQYNLSNVMCAVAVSSYFGVADSFIKKGIENYLPDNNRSQVEHTDRGNTVILDCYNANPSSMQASILNLVNGSDSKSKVAILGDMLELGDQADQEHQKIIGLIQANPISQVILVGPLFSKTSHDNEYETFSNTRELQDFLSKHPIENAEILLKGSRGLKLETVFNEL